MFGTVDDVLLLDDIFVEGLQEVGVHSQTPAVRLDTAALCLQLLQQGVPPPVPCSSTTDSHYRQAFCGLLAQLTANKLEEHVSVVP